MRGRFVSAAGCDNEAIDLALRTGFFVEIQPKNDIAAEIASNIQLFIFYFLITVDDIHTIVHLWMERLKKHTH